ncbi:ThuA domain-containing protein, partial [Schumannella luteola]
MTDALLLTGGGDFGDPWHPFPATAGRIAEVLAAIGVGTRIVDTAAAFAAGIEDGPQLAIVQASNAYAATPGDQLVLIALDRHLRAGRPMLGVHAAACLFVDRPEWERMLGGRWVPDASWHPELGDTRVQLDPHPVTTGLGDVHLVDERYTALRMSPRATAFAWHEEGGVRHPLAWAHEADGLAAVAAVTQRST